MVSAQVSRSALGAAWCRFVEQSEPEPLRLFTDSVVGQLLDPAMKMMAQPGIVRDHMLSSLGDGVYGLQVLRTRYFDDIVRQQLTHGVDQVVIVGAGLDTRAFRLAALGSATVYEVDLPSTQRYKQRQLRGLTPLAGSLHYLPVDLVSQPLLPALLGVGFDPRRPALFVLEGVSQYLTGVVMNSILTDIGRCAPRTAVVMTYVLGGASVGAARTWSANGLPQLLDFSEAWHFDIDPARIAAYLDEFGAVLIDDVGASDHQQRYLRPMGRELLVSPGERIAFALVRRSRPA